MTLEVVAAFSELINKPVATLAGLVQSRSRTLRLRRRGDEDLILVVAANYEQDRTVMHAAVRIIAALARRDDPSAATLFAVLDEVFPWVHFLPPADQRQFAIELVQTLRAADSIDNLTPVAQLITEWRHTAEAWADPQVADALRSSGDDFGPVPAPSTDVAAER
jgi:hypothetical protein